MTTPKSHPHTQVATILFFFCCMTLACTLELPNQIPGWFYSFRFQSLSWLGSLLWMGGVFGLLFLLPRLKGLYVPLLLFIVFWLGQYLFAFIGDGTLLEHTALSGHSEFAITGSRKLDIGALLSNYEEFVEQPSQQYARSKPPGQVILYCLLGRVSMTPNTNIPLEFVDSAHAGLGILLTIVLPFCAALTIFPMYAWCKLLLKERAWIPVLLFSCSAPPLLIVMHFDQALYPLIFCFTLWSLSYATLQKNTFAFCIYIICAGIIFALGSFVTFSLLGGLFLLIALGLHHQLSIQRWITSIFCLLFGFVLVYTILWLGYDYNPIERYQDAMHNHKNWKGFPWTWTNWWIATKVNVIEFFWGLGPVGVLLFSQWKTKNILYRGLWITIFILLFFGNISGEVGRLWLFIVPFLWTTLGFSLRKETIKTAVICTALWTLLLKCHMDYL